MPYPNWIAVKTGDTTYRLARLLFHHLETAGVYKLHASGRALKFLDAVNEAHRLNMKHKKVEEKSS